MFISYEELQEMEARYYEELKSAQAHLDVIRELMKLAEEKEVVEEPVEEIVEEQEETIEEIA